MDYLDSLVKLWLSMLTNLVSDNVFGAVLWVFVLVMVSLLLIRIWRGVTAWKQ